MTDIQKIKDELNSIEFENDQDRIYILDDMRQPTWLNGGKVLIAYRIAIPQSISNDVKEISNLIVKFIREDGCNAVSFYEMFIESDTSLTKSGVNPDNYIRFGTMKI
jgi:hypothetical protein